MTSIDRKDYQFSTPNLLKIIYLFKLLQCVLASDGVTSAGLPSVTDVAAVSESFGACWSQVVSVTQLRPQWRYVGLLPNGSFRVSHTQGGHPGLSYMVVLGQQKGKSGSCTFSLKSQRIHLLNPIGYSKSRDRVSPYHGQSDSPTWRRVTKSLSRNMCFRDGGNLKSHLCRQHTKEDLP